MNKPLLIFALSALTLGTLTPVFTACDDDDPKQAPFTLTIPSAQLSLNVGGKATLVPEGMPEGATLTWKSSQPNVVSVADGQITALAEGEAIITVRAEKNGVASEAECRVRVTDPFVRIADAALNTFILSLEGVDADKDGRISKTEALAVKEVVCNFENKSDADNEPAKVVRSLKGLENFTNLERLDLKNQSVEDATPLYGLTHLTYLHLGNNDIPALDLSQLTALTDLRVYGNTRLSTVNLTGLTALETLYIQDTGLTSIDLTPAKALADVNLNRTKLKNVLLAGLPKLEKILIIGNEQLNTLALEDLPALRELHANNNGLQSVTLRRLPELQILNLYGNKLTTFHGDLPKLMMLYLNDNQITTIDLEHLPFLLRLIVSNNPLELLDLSHNEYVRMVEAEYMPNLTTINLRNGGYAEDEAEYMFGESNPKLTKVICDEGAELTHVKNHLKNNTGVSIVTE